MKGTHVARTLQSKPEYTPSNETALKARNEMAAVTVHNLDTQEEIIFVGLTHAEAVRNAFAQFERRDFSTWEYDRRYPLSMVKMRSHGDKRVYSLAQFSAVAGLSEVAN